MKLGAAAAALVGLPAATGDATAASIKVMDDPSPSNRHVGGGKTYRDTVRREESDFVAENRGALLDALDDARRGDVVYVPNYAEIDLTGEENLAIGNGVTLASGRGLGRKGAPGGLIYTDSRPDPMFQIRRDDVRVTGLRIRGPRIGYFDPSDLSKHVSRGLSFLGDDPEVDNCQLFGWPVAAVSVGSKHTANSAHVHHNSIHDNALEGYGYGVMLYNGHSLVERNYFGHNRHAICAFGYETNGYEACHNLIGPRTVSHAFDVHGLNQNGGDANVAGGTIHIHHNTFMFTRDVFDRGQEAVTIRGVPDDRALLEKNSFEHDERPDDEDVGENGQAYRQYNTGSDGWERLDVRANHFGTHRPCADVGLRRPRDSRWGKAMPPANGDGPASGLRFWFDNPFDQRLTITAVTINPSSKAVAALKDGSGGEGMWRSEVFVKADVQNGTTDVHRGVDLPGTIDLDADGHASSPDTEPVLSPGSRAYVRLCEFVDGDDDPISMLGRSTDVNFAYRLADGANGVDVFTVNS